MSAQQPVSDSVKHIPWLDMQPFLNGTPEERFAIAQKFGESLIQLGFVAVTNIGISNNTIDHAYAMAKRYFGQPETIKLKTHTCDGHQGYTPFGCEHAKYTDIIDLKEFFQTTGPNHQETLWPEMPGFKPAMLSLYEEIENCMRQLLQATAIFLGYTAPEEQTILSDMIGSGNCVMRVIHYPPVDPVICPPGAIRAAPHEDLCIMTIIPRTSGPGLQVQTTQGEWIDVVVPENAAIINSGDSLSILTNGLIPSTTHRVINPATEDTSSHRYSIPMFGNLIPSTPLKILSKCSQEPSKFPQYNKMVFNDFREERFAHIGLSSEPHGKK